MDRFMRYSYSDAVRSVLAQAAREADDLRHDYLGTAHILLALLREDAGPATTILFALQLDRESARTRLLERLRPGTLAVPLGELPYTTRARRVLEAAMTSADEFSESTVDVDHLLIGLMSVDEGIAASTLASWGVSAEAVMREARRLRS